VADIRPEIAVQYLRRSSDKQEDSTEQQARIIAAYTLGKGYLPPTDVKAARWEETGSGRSFLDRPIFQRLVATIESGALRADVLVMYRPSRFGRSEDLTEFHYYEHRFKRAGVRIEYASGTEYNIPGLAGHLTRTLAYAQAGEYSKDLSNYSTRGLLENARNGFSTGGEPALGYERMLVDRQGGERGLLPPGARKGDDRTLKVKYVLARDAALVEAIRTHVFRRPYEMGWGAAKTARELNKLLRQGKGISPPRSGRVIKRQNGREVPYGTTWQANTIYEMWTRYTFIGWRTLVIEADNEFHGEQVTTKDAHDPLIDEETFWGLFERTKGRPWNVRKLGPHRRREPGRYPLSGLGVCTHCGKGFGGSRTHNKVKGSEEFYYRDVGETNGGICTAPCWSIPVKSFDPWVRERIVTRLESEFFQESLLAALRQRLMPEAEVCPSDAAVARLREVERGIENLLNLAMHASTPSPALASRLDGLEQEKARLQAEVVSGTRRTGPKVTNADLARVAAAVTKMAEQVLTADGELLAELAPRFIHRYVVDKEKRLATVEFYNVPGLRTMPEPGSRIERVEAAGVEPASEASSNSRDTWPSAYPAAGVIPFGDRQSSLFELCSSAGCPSAESLRACITPE
jgi:DNA invertase Pin-like site-specific DNA recombinase